MNSANHRTRSVTIPWLGAAMLFVLRLCPLTAADIDRPPINYAKARADNAVTRLQERLSSGKAKLTFEDDRGYAKSLLKELNVPVSSQVLVFSKTSLQRDRICPKTPRAIYFNDDVYVGFCLRGDVMELAAVDPKLGTVFYTLDQEPAAKPVFTRHTDACLICHSSSISRGMPGHVVRSVYPDVEGIPYLSAGTFRTDHTSPFKERWGGWYVTGTHGEQKHMGNWTLNKRQEADEGPGVNCQNVEALNSRFTTSFYLSPHSDIVALMTLEHQAEMHNRLAFAALETRMALHYQDELNKALNEKPGTRFDSTKNRIRSAGDAVVKYMLFCEEAAITDPVKGTSGFNKEFAVRGPFDSKGRSLRQFDLQTRLFKYPCSYLIYSEAFDKTAGRRSRICTEADPRRPDRQRQQQRLRTPVHRGSPGNSGDSAGDQTQLAGLLEMTYRLPYSDGH